MSKLKNLYLALENLQSAGFPIDDKLMAQISELEEKIIKNDILPVLQDTIQPALSQVKRDLVLVVEYTPDQPISVKLSRKRSFVNELPDVKLIEPDPVVEHTTRGSNSADHIKRRPARPISVIFPDGTIIAEKKANDTLYQVVKKIGVKRVRKVVEEYNLKFCKVPIISNRRDEKYGKTQKDLGDGWLLMTHSNNPMKRDFIHKLSNILNLGIRVELDE